MEYGRRALSGVMDQVTKIGVLRVATSPDHLLEWETAAIRCHRSACCPWLRHLIAARR